MPPSGYGQSVVDKASFRTMSVGGIHLYGVSVFGGYSTSAYPGGLGQIPVGAGQLGADINYGVSTSLGWQYHRQRTVRLDQMQHVALNRGEIEFGGRRGQVASLREEQLRQELPSPTSLVLAIH